MFSYLPINVFQFLETMKLGKVNNFVKQFLQYEENGNCTLIDISIIIINDDDNNYVIGIIII